LFVITNVFVPVVPADPDSWHEVSEASTVIWAGASEPSAEPADSSLAWQPLYARAARAAVSTTG
jgi:hypothetical protein